MSQVWGLDLLNSPRSVQETPAEEDEDEWDEDEEGEEEANEADDPEVEVGGSTGMPSGSKVSGEDTKNEEATGSGEVSVVQDPQSCKVEGQAAPVEKETSAATKEDQTNLNKAPKEHDDPKAKKPENANAPATKFEEPKLDEKSDASTLVALKLL